MIIVKIYGKNSCKFGMIHMDYTTTELISSDRKGNSSNYDYMVVIQNKQKKAKPFQKKITHTKKQKTQQKDGGALPLPIWVYPVDI